MKEGKHSIFKIRQINVFIVDCFMSVLCYRHQAMIFLQQFFKSSKEHSLHVILFFTYYKMKLYSFCEKNYVVYNVSSYQQQHNYLKEKMGVKSRYYYESKCLHSVENQIIERHTDILLLIIFKIIYIYFSCSCKIQEQSFKDLSQKNFDNKSNYLVTNNTFKML